MPPRQYRMTDRAKAQDETRERIVRATMALHDEQGVAATSFVDVAKRAGLGAATVYRHFPNLGALVMACGAHVWAEMEPPVPEQAPAIFAGIVAPEERLLRLAGELDAFYRRGALRLHAAGRDRDVVPELDGFLRQVAVGVEALVREALAPQSPTEEQIRLVLALTDFAVWESLQRLELAPPELARLIARLIGQALTIDAKPTPSATGAPAPGPNIHPS